ncbi:unnamed protein product [Coffea canephora]|uniref:Uncharacterized protein n=1 Tax=Coffea canephora TaxID=49390 RepID=A0A068U3Z0_COFCA|nr:unnamed protein product [Coffea canephora]
MIYPPELLIINQRVVSTLSNSRLTFLYFHLTPPPAQFSRTVSQGPFRNFSPPPRPFHLPPFPQSGRNHQTPNPALPPSLSFKTLPIFNDSIISSLQLKIPEMHQPKQKILSPFILGFFCCFLTAVDQANVGNAALLESNSSSPDKPKEDSFADMMNRALEKEFNDTNEQSDEIDHGSFNNSVAEQQAVLETVARVRTKKNDTKEEYTPMINADFQLHDVFNFDFENRDEDMPRLIDQEDNEFTLSNSKSKFPILQLDIRLISDLVVVIVSATCGGIAFACAGQPVITGYLLAGSVVGPGGFSIVSEMVQVC